MSNKYWWMRPLKYLGLVPGFVWMLVLFMTMTHNWGKWLEDFLFIDVEVLFVVSSIGAPLTLLIGILLFPVSIKEKDNDDEQ